MDISQISFSSSLLDTLSLFLYFLLSIFYKIAPTTLHILYHSSQVSDSGHLPFMFSFNLYHQWWFPNLGILIFSISQLRAPDFNLPKLYTLIFIKPFHMSTILRHTQPLHTHTNTWTQTHDCAGQHARKTCHILCWMLETRLPILSYPCPCS